MAYDPVTRLKTMGLIGDVEWDLCAFQEPVSDGPVSTARGVASGIDLAHRVVHRLAGEEARTHLARQRDYPYKAPLH